MSVINVETGQKIFKEGELNNAMYIILKGQVEILLTTGKEQTKLAILSEGDFFGEISLFSAKPRSATAKAVSRTQLAVISSKQILENYLLKNPKFSAKMVSIMAGRLAKTNELLVEKMEKKSAGELEYSKEVSE